ncbi:hypothetical protein L873DRAFT_1802391 [Choiromyces venosus 120613-1]|uniref:Uncharacterized protein n=1 Tax=Choiromyces venosus 120613-1 TaxID=1336337 RepID=A0A3N4JZS0_9PEZI|nr:hypothetical protein L873DRAFT_1802391 [Choiromyces venosus 120613-1]
MAPLHLIATLARQAAAHGNLRLPNPNQLRAQSLVKPVRSANASGTLVVGEPGPNLQASPVEAINRRTMASFPGPGARLRAYPADFCSPGIHYGGGVPGRAPGGVRGDLETLAGRD